MPYRINVLTGRLDYYDPGISVLGDPVTIDHGGTNKTSYIGGSIPYYNSTTSKLEEDNAYFQYNSVSHWLSIGGVASARLHVLGTEATHIGKFDIGLDFNQVAVPTGVISLSLLGVPGNVDVGSHFYRYTLVTALGETALNNGVGATTTGITTVAGNQQVLVSGIPISTDYRVTHINIYRSTTNNPYYIGVKKVGQVANGVTTFTDNISDASRTGVDNYSRPNTTNRFITVNGLSSMMIDPLNALFGYRTGESVLAGTAAGGENAIYGSLSAISLIGGKNAAIGQSIAVGSSDSSVFAGHSAGGLGALFLSCIIMGRNSAFWNTYSQGSVILGGAKGTSYYSAHFITSIGADALGNITTGAEHLITIGPQSGNNITTAKRSIIIGSFVNAPSATTDGQLNIGNVLFGLGIYGQFGTSSTPTAASQIGIGIVPTAGLARLEIVAGSTTYVPFRLNSGALKTGTLPAGGIEFLTDDIFVTITTGLARKAFVLDDGTRLTATRVPFATTNGRLTDVAGFTFVTDTLTSPKIVGSTSVKVGTAAGYISSDGSTGATGTFTTVDGKTVTVKDGIITAIV